MEQWEQRRFEEFQPSSSTPPTVGSHTDNHPRQDGISIALSDVPSSQSVNDSKPTAQAEAAHQSLYPSPESDPETALYYHALELTPSATQEEIKSQYKRLVRLYHPDQFIDARQKHLAEERLKAVNEAYRILSSRAVEGQLVKYAQLAMGLEVEPSVLDFGLLDRRQQRTAAFQVRFEKNIEGVDFVPSEEDGWFRVAKVSHVYGSHYASLEFEVEVDTTGLTPQTYQGWIDLYLDNAMTRLPLTMQVAARPWQTLRLPRRWVLAATFLLAFLFFTTTMAFTNVGQFAGGVGSVNLEEKRFSTGRNSLGNNSLPSSRASLEHGLAALNTTQLYFALLDGAGQPAIYRADLRNNATPQLVSTGTQASGLQSRNLIAYLKEQAGYQQLYLHNQATGQTEQLSTDPTPKSALAWSADGTYLAYLVGRGAEARIGLYNVESHEEYRLPGEITAGVSNFAWSPDGKSLLFDLWRGDERRVYRMAVPDGALQQLTQFDSWAGSWSPDGNSIVVGSTTGLYRLDSSGRQLRQISTEAAERPLWSADGVWIAFLSHSLEDSNTERRLWLVHPDGSSASHVATDILWHAWSPEGGTLAYVTGQHQTAESLYYLWVAQPMGEAYLIAEITEPYFSWSHP